MLRVLTHAVGYIPDRFEAARLREQTQAMQEVPRQVSLKTLLLITTLLCGASAAVSAAMRSAQHDQTLKQSK